MQKLGIKKQIMPDGSIQEIVKCVVHKFKVGDVEDPDLYAAQPIWEWQNTEKGKFIMENAIDKPEWQRHIDHLSFQYDYAIIAEIPSIKVTEYFLKWGKND